MSREEQMIKDSIDSVMQRDAEYKASINKRIDWISFRQKVGIAIQLLILITMTLIYINMENNNEVAKAIIDAFKPVNDQIITK